KIDGKELTPGKDHIVEAVSGSGKGEFKVETVNEAPKSKDEIKEFFRKNFRNKVLVVDIKNQDKDAKEFIASLKRNELPNESKPAAVIISEDKKLTMDIEGKAFSYPVFSVMSNSLPEKIENVSFEVENKLLI